MSTQKDALDLAAVMSRIAKIRSLAERGGTPHEAEVAAAKMADLLLRYNLTLADVDAFAIRTGRTVITEDYLVRADRWQFALLHTIATAHLCTSIQLGAPRNHRKRLQVIGHEHNLIVVRETWPWLQRETERLARAALQLARDLEDEVALSKPGTWDRGFKLGVVHGIAQAYAAMKATVKAEVGNAWAMVPVLENEVAQEMDRLYPERKQGKGSKRVSVDAYASGIAAGRAINLQRQVGAARAEALAG